MMQSVKTFLAFCSAIVVGSACGEVVRGAEVSFAKEVWPLLRGHCFACHSGPKAEGKLRLDGAEHLARGGESGPLFEAGKAEGSSLLEQVSGPKPAMPPEGTPLSAAQVDVLRRWIVGGGRIDSFPVDPAATVVVPNTYEFAPAVTSVAFSSDGKRAACAVRSEAVIVSLDDAGFIAKQKPLRLATDCDLLTLVEFSPDGKLLVAAGGTPGRFGEIRFYEAASGKLVGSRRLTNDTLFRGAFSPDGKRVALGGSDGAVYLVPIDAEQEVRRIELHSDWVVDVCWTPDGERIVSVGRDKTTKIASSETLELLRTIDTSAERVNAVAADDKFAFSAGLTKALTAYELPIALQNIELSGSGNGARPVSRVNQYLRALEAQPGEVLDLSLSGDRRLLAAAGSYADVRIFTAADRKRVAVVPYPAGAAYAIALNADGTRLLVGGRSGTLELFDLPSAKPSASLAPVPVRGR